MANFSILGLTGPDTDKGTPASLTVEFYPSIGESFIKSYSPPEGSPRLVRWTGNRKAFLSIRGVEIGFTRDEALSVSRGQKPPFLLQLNALLEKELLRDELAQENHGSAPLLDGFL